MLDFLASEGVDLASKGGPGQQRCGPGQQRWTWLLVASPPVASPAAVADKILVYYLIKHMLEQRGILHLKYYMRTHTIRGLIFGC